MAHRVVYEMNRMTRERHAELLGKVIHPSKPAASEPLVQQTSMDINNNDDKPIDNPINLDQPVSNFVEESADDIENFTPEYKRFSIMSETSEQEVDPYKDIEVSFKIN